MRVITGRHRGAPGRGVWVSALALLLSHALPASAQVDLNDAVSVTGGATCVGKESLLAQVEGWLGTRVIDAGLRVSIVGSATDARDVAFDIRRDGTLIARRRFAPAPASCAQLEATLALALALALKVSLRDELLGGTVIAPPEVGTGFALGANLAAGMGLLPGASFGAAVVAQRSVGERLLLRADASALTARDLTFARAPGGFDAWLATLRLMACTFSSMARTVTVRACLGLSMGGLKVRGHGYARSHATWLPRAAVSNALGLTWFTSKHWAVDVAAALSVPVGTLQVAVDRTGGGIVDTQRLPWGGAELALGPLYLF